MEGRERAKENGGREARKKARNQESEKNKGRQNDRKVPPPQGDACSMEGQERQKEVTKNREL